MTRNSLTATARKFGLMRPLCELLALALPSHLRQRPAMNHWTQLASVACGGAVGAVARFLLNSWAVRVFPKFAPAGTLLVNVLGCLVIGFLVSAFETREEDSQVVRAFLVTGLLGSLTTFSTFGFQTVELAREGSTKLAVVNVVANLAVGLPAVVMGLWLGRRLTGG